MQITRIKNDINGNSRRVVHFIDLVTEQDRKDAPSDFSRISHLYSVALNRSRKIGGRKYHTKSFGGGIVFQAYSDNELERDIAKLLKS
jgi:hypothetical protein